MFVECPIKVRYQRLKAGWSPEDAISKPVKILKRKAKQGIIQ